jgi:hypothetical protein
MCSLGDGRSWGDGQKLTMNRSLEKPLLTGSFKSDVVSIDHNQYIKNLFSYQSNYGAGLRVLDVSSVPFDPTGKGIKEVAFFDGISSPSYIMESVNGA